MTTTPLAPPQPVKPRLRGWIHFWSFVGSVAAGAALVTAATTTGWWVAALATAGYSATICLVPVTSDAAADAGLHLPWTAAGTVDVLDDWLCHTGGSMGMDRRIFLAVSGAAVRSLHDQLRATHAA